MKLAPFAALLLVCGSAAARDVGQIPPTPIPRFRHGFERLNHQAALHAVMKPTGIAKASPSK